MERHGTYKNKEIHRRWESVYRNNAIQGQFNEKLMDRIVKALGPAPGDYFLDAGCGSGDHLVRIARRGFRCVGVDISHCILEKAERAIVTGGLQSLASVECQPLESLMFADDTFDFVHCRGVLMHIPEWEAALGQLVRVLKPGGRIVILEANRRSLEAHVVGLVRRMTRRKYRLIETRGGLEFWSEVDGAPFVVRMADLEYLSGWLESRDMKVVERFATEFLDINRFPGGPLRKGIIRFNRLWFSLGLPPSLCSANALVAEKVAVS